MRSERNNRAKKKSKKLGTFTKIWAILYIIAVGAFVAVLLHFNMLPAKYLYMVIGGLVLISVLLVIPLFSRRFKKSRKIIAIIFSCLLMIVYGLGIVYMTGTLDFFSKVTSVGVQTEDYYVLVKDDSEYKEIDEINGMTVQTYLTNEKNYSAAKGKLKKKEDVKYEMKEKLSDLSEGLTNGDYDVVFVSASHYDSMCEKDESFSEVSRILYTVKIEIKTEDISKDVDVTKESFNVYISGLDVQGSIDVVSRSDVNMIVTINPKTHTVLLTSIPRDYEIKLPSKDDATDKLTHTGIYGVNETVGAVENLMNIDINYYAKVNYTTITKFVDAIDGITVDSDYTFTTSGMHINGLDGITFYKGENNLNGNRALAFARERHSFKDGDVQRTRNQQKIVEAIINKAASSTTLLTKYTTILNSIENNVELNMTSDDIKALVKMQLDDMPSWTILKQNLIGTGKTKQCYSTGDYYVYVMEPNEDSVINAVDNIIAVMNGTDGGKLNELTIEEDGDSLQ